MKYNKKWIIIGVIIIAFILVFILFGNKEVPKPKEENIANNNNIGISEEVIYGDDNGINEFIKKYNKLYSENPITSEKISKAHIGGSDRDDAIDVLLNNSQIRISNEYETRNQYKIGVYIDNMKKENNDNVKEMFFTFMKVFDSTLSEKKLEIYWTLQTDDGSSNNNRFGEIESYTMREIDTDKVEYTKIEGYIDK